MWMVTKLGFISAVRHDTDDGFFLVRARRREDLEQSFPDHLDQIVEMAQADYRWRVKVGIDDMFDFMADAVETIDYTTHAKEAMAGDDGDRYRAYLDVWSALYKLQDPAGLVGTWTGLADGDGGYDSLDWSETEMEET